MWDPKEYRRTYIREYFRKRRSLFRSLHLCSECGKEDNYTKQGYKQCKRCRERIIRNFKNSAERKQKRMWGME